MNSILSKPHSDVNWLNQSLWRVWYSTNAGTSVTQLGTAPISTITPVVNGGKYFATIVLTDANLMDGNVLRSGDFVNVVCTGADTKFSIGDVSANQPAQIVGVNVGASITVQLPNTSYSGSATSGTLILKNRVRHAMFAGCSRTGTANTGAITYGPAYGSLALPFSAAAASAVVSTTITEPQGSAFLLSDWNYKLATANDTLFVVYK